MPGKKPKDMSLAEMDVEFKSLSKDLEPIASRRSEIDRERKRRLDKAAMQAHVHAMTQDDKEALYLVLKKELAL